MVFICHRSACHSPEAFDRNRVELIMVHGRDEVLVIAAEEFRRLKGDHTGEARLAAMQESPYRDIDIEPPRAPMPVRSVDL